jgi:hypothetical protein
LSCLIFFHTKDLIMFKKILYISALATLASATTAQAVIYQLTSFENGVVGQTFVAGGGLVVDSGAGITEGTKAVRYTVGSGTYEKLTQYVLPTTPGGLLSPGSSVTSYIVDWNLASFGGSGYFNLTAALYNATTNTFTQLTGTGQSPGADGQYSVTYTLNAAQTTIMNTAIANGQSIQIELFANKAATRTGTLTVDNIRFDGISVPEPSSLALGLLALVGTLRRRRN